MSLPKAAKSAAKFAFQHAGGVALTRRLHRDGLRILMYHRFSSRAALRRQCAHIRKHYYPVSMTMVAEWLHDGRRLPPYALAITVDDGYGDFQENGHPVFTEYGLPVTVFLVTDFLDGKIWLWFDRVVDAFRRGKADTASIEVPGGGKFECKLGSEESRRREGQRLADLAVNWSTAERRKMVGELPAILQAEMPDEVPTEYRPLEWDAVRAMAASGVEFGAHTKTHPILSAVEDPQELRDEIAGSKARIEAELDRPVIHFCYPNGKMRDIGSKAEGAVKAAGMRTAVTAEPGLNYARQNAFLLRRVGVDPSHEELYFQRGVAGFGLQ